MDQDQLLCVKDVAGLLGVSTQLVMRLVRRGRLVCVRVGDRLLRFRREDVQSYIQKQRMATPQPETPAVHPSRKSARSSADAVSRPGKGKETR